MLEPGGDQGAVTRRRGDGGRESGIGVRVPRFKERRRRVAVEGESRREREREREKENV